MPVRTLMTAEQFDALPEEEGRKWELLDGELIDVSSATPEHNRILMRLAFLLYSAALQTKQGAVLPETDLAVRTDSRLRPDLGYFSSRTWQSIDIKRAPIVHPPDIAIEIISPSETASTINRKVQAYLGWGVQEVWLIYPETRTVDVRFRGKAEILAEGEFLATGLIPDWRIPVSEIFADI
jgi:Uma2 family endonuclease